MRRLISTVSAGALVLAGCSSPSKTPEFRLPQIIEFSAPDLVNPMRGQYRNLATPLFPPADQADDRYPRWPGSTDTSIRIDWRTLQPRDPRTVPAAASDSEKYDFSVIDTALAIAAATHSRIGIRVSAFNSCCDTHYPNNTDISVPDWLLTVPGATRTYRHAGINYVIPDWNNVHYLSHFVELLAALGRRYDRNERLLMFEMSGYGDFSENHVAFMRDTLMMPGPNPEDSERKLGYFSQYQDQYITKDSITTLVDATLSAFPNTWLITAAGNPEITRQLLFSSPRLRSRVKSVGIRADGLGVFRPIPAWAESPYSRYVQLQDPIVNVVANRYRIAPIVTEWIPNPPKPIHPMDYYQTGLRDVVNDHVSMTASTGFPAQVTKAPMPSDQFEVWSKANKFSGYRYAVTSTEIPDAVPPLSPFTLSFRWTNFGVAPTYERWEPQYDIVSSSGHTVRTLRAGLDLVGLVADQHFDEHSQTPASISTLDRVTVDDGLAAGTYVVRVRVGWNEHKPEATTTVDFPPMHLAQTERGADGSYPILQFRVG